MIGTRVPDFRLFFEQPRQSSLRVTFPSRNGNHTRDCREIARLPFEIFGPLRHTPSVRFHRGERKRERERERGRGRCERRQRRRNLQHFSIRGPRGARPSYIIHENTWPWYTATAGNATIDKIALSLRGTRPKRPPDG